MNEKKVLIILPHHLFHDKEYQTVRLALNEAKIVSETGSSHLSEAQGKHKMIVHPDVTLSYTEASDYDGFIFIGEDAAEEYYHNSDTLRIINEACQTNKLLGAIGKAVPILAYSGKMSGLLATSTESERKLVEELGAFFTGLAVERNGDFLTASGPEASEEFINTFISELTRKNPVLER